MKQSASALCVVMTLLSGPLFADPLPFNDPSFENAGSTTMVDYDVDNSSFYDEGAIDGNHQLNGVPAGVWRVNNLNDDVQTMELRLISDLAAAGGTGLNYIWGSQQAGTWADRTFFQYIIDSKATRGKITATIDYWAHIRNGVGGDGVGKIGLQLFAFDDLATVWVDTGNSSANNGYVNDGSASQNSGPRTWANCITSTSNVLTQVNVVDASTGFQTITTTLDLGASGYSYIGIAITIDEFESTSTANGDTVAFDNLVVQNHTAGLVFQIR